MRALGYGVLAAAAAASLYIVWELKPTSLAAGALLGAWLILPYMAVALYVRRASVRNETLSAVVIAVLFAAASLLWKTFIVFLAPDAQGAIAVLLTPVYQAVGFALLLVAAGWLRR